MGSCVPIRIPARIERDLLKITKRVEPMSTRPKSVLVMLLYGDRRRGAVVGAGRSG